jgi:hypothetical protein
MHRSTRNVGSLKTRPVREVVVGLEIAARAALCFRLCFLSSLGLRALVTDWICPHSRVHPMDSSDSIRLLSIPRPSSQQQQLIVVDVANTMIVSVPPPLFLFCVTHTIALTAGCHANERGAQRNLFFCL